MKKSFLYIVIFLFLMISLCLPAQSSKKIILIKKPIIGKPVIEDPIPPIVPKNYLPSSFFDIISNPTQVEITALSDMGTVQLTVVNRLTGCVYNQLHELMSYDAIVIPTFTWAKGYYTLTAYYNEHYFIGDFFVDNN